jgi:agmatinase
MGTSTSSQPPVPSVRGEPATAEADRGRTGTVPPGGEPPEFLASLRSMYGPEVRFLGCPPVDLRDAESVAQCDVVIIGAPFDSGTSYRSGARFGPQAIRAADYNPHIPVRPSLALGIDPFDVLTIADAGDILMPPAQFELSLARLEDAVATVAERDAIPVVLGGDHSIALADVRGVARRFGFGRVAVLHFDAHCDSFYTEFGSLYGHGTPMRRLLECGAARGDRFFQVGLRGYWPDRDHQAWMRDQGMRWYEMAEIGSRGLDACLDEVFELATKDCDAVFCSIDIDVVDPAMAPGTGTPEVGGLTSRQMLDAARRCAAELPVVGMDLVEVAPAYDGPGQITAFLANRIVLEMLCGIARQRASERGET